MELGLQNDIKYVLPSEFIKKALILLPERAKEVLEKRFDLGGTGRKTLEETGEAFKITRERVRQIEKAAIDKIKAVNSGDIDEIGRIFVGIINQFGGIMERDFFLTKALEYFDKNIPKEKRNKQEKQNIVLVLRMTSGIKQGGDDGKLKEYLYINNEAVNSAETVIAECEKIFAKEGHAMAGNEIFAKAMREESLTGKNISEEIFYSFLHLPLSIARNTFFEWGLSEWSSISPKSVKDKSYLIMKHQKKPLHFKEIAALIGQSWKKKKPVLAETVHNELIKNRQFVLIGRGIYALAEWGYERGAVRDIIKSVLAKSSKPMSREDVTKEVMLQRLVKPGTIALNLKDENDFEKTSEGLYKLKVKSS